MIMGYAIQYGRPTKLEEERNVAGRKRKLKTAVAAVILSAGIYLGSTGKLSAMCDWLIPGDKEVTKEAFSQLTQRIKRGEDFSDSVAAFCQEIISNARPVSESTS
jgi:hypothetical protein